MKTLSTACIVAILTFATSAFFTPASKADLGYDVQSTVLVIDREGTVHVTQALTVNETYPEITLKLLAPKIENVRALIENQTSLNCTVNGYNITIVTLGSKTITLDYYTADLTTKKGGVWNLTLETPYNTTVYMPKQATITYLSDVPISIKTQDERNILELQPGKWEISYSLPTATPTPPTSPKPEEITLMVAIAAVIAWNLFLFFRKRSAPSAAEKVLKGHPELRAEEREVIEFIAQKGGKVMEAEIRKRFNLPKTSVWRMTKRLERSEVVTIKKIGTQNQIELSES